MIPANISALIEQTPSDLFPLIQEIRLRLGRPLMIGVGNEDYVFGSTGWAREASDPYIVTKEDMSRPFS